MGVEIRPVIQDHLGPDQRLDPGFAGGLPEAGGTGQGVAVDQGDGGQTELDRPVDEVLGLGGAFEEGEGRGAVELSVTRAHVSMAFLRPRPRPDEGGPGGGAVDRRWGVPVVEISRCLDERGDLKRVWVFGLGRGASQSDADADAGLAVGRGCGMDSSHARI